MVLLTAHVGPATLAASGVMIGAALLVLGATGWIARLARAVPQSIWRASNWASASRSPRSASI